MQLTITINCDNAAFDDGYSDHGAADESARILMNLANQLKGQDFDPNEPFDSIPLRDVNGNRVGKCEIASSACDIKPLLTTVIQYLEHPDVLKIPFALSAGAIAQRVRVVIAGV